MIGRIIKDRRLELDLTLEQVGSAVGVNKSTVQRWESGGIVNLKQDKVVSLAQILKVTPGYLLGVEELQEVKCFSVDLSDLDEQDQESVLLFIDYIRYRKRKGRKS